MDSGVLPVSGTNGFLAACSATGFCAADAASVLIPTAVGAIPAIPESAQSRCLWEPGRAVSCSAVRKKRETYAQQFAVAFLRCRLARELGAAKRAVLPDVPHQTARSSAEAYQFRGWKTALPEIPALWVREAPDL